MYGTFVLWSDGEEGDLRWTNERKFRVGIVTGKEVDGLVDFLVENVLTPLRLSRDEYSI